MYIYSNSCCSVWLLVLTATRIPPLLCFYFPLSLSHLILWTEVVVFIFLCCFLERDDVALPKVRNARAHRRPTSKRIASSPQTIVLLFQLIPSDHTNRSTMVLHCSRVEDLLLQNGCRKRFKNQLFGWKRKFLTPSRKDRSFPALFSMSCLVYLCKKCSSLLFTKFWIYQMYLFMTVYIYSFLFLYNVFVFFCFSLSCLY